jgi:hypothetical protein
MMLGPEKVRYIRSLKPPARAMCISESLEGVARAVKILQEANIEPERVYIAYNPEPRPPGARQCTPREELDDYLGSLKKARELVKDYGAPLIMGPGLIEMAKREHLYPEMAKHCDIWMIQTQRLQLDLETQTSPSGRAIPRRSQADRRALAARQSRHPGVRADHPLAGDSRAERGVHGRAVGLLPAGGRGPGRRGEDLWRQHGADRGSDPAAAEPSPAAAGRFRRNGAEASKRTEMIEMRDGARLATDLYLPPPRRDKSKTASRSCWSALPTTRTRSTAASSVGEIVLLDNGYAFAIQDMRGFYASATGEPERPRPVRRLRHDRVAGPAAVVQRQGRHDGLFPSRRRAVRSGRHAASAPGLRHSRASPGQLLHRLPLSAEVPQGRLGDDPSRPLHSRTDVLLNTRIRRQGNPDRPVQRSHDPQRRLVRFLQGRRDRDVPGPAAPGRSGGAAARRSC